MAVADRHGTPVGVYFEGAAPQEVKLFETTLDAMVLPYAPSLPIGDEAYDSDGLDQRLMERYGTALIAPNRGNRDAGWKEVATLRAAMEVGARVRLVAEPAKAGVALRVPCNQLSQLPAARLYHHPAAPFFKKGSTSPQ
jgi:hypothetical protein